MNFNKKGMGMIIKKYCYACFFIITLFCSYCYGQNEDITLNFKIKKKDVGKIEFRAPEKKDRAKKDMTSIVDSMWYVGDTLYVLYMQQSYEGYYKHDCYGGMSYIAQGKLMVVPQKKYFIQHLSVPQKPEYICLNNGNYIFYFKRSSLQEYQLIEYNIVNNEEQKEEKIK